MKFIAAITLLLTTVGTSAAQDRFAYVLSFPDASSHYADVQAEFPADGLETIELMMAVWTPGSYLVREYARHVEGITARAPDGTAVPIEKTQKNRWRVETGGASRVQVRYRLYCREMTVRTNWVEADFAILNGAPTFLTRVGELQRPHEVTLDVPSEWMGSWTGMPAHPDGAPNHYLAPDFDTLVDSPIYAGSPTVYPIEVDGIQHFLVNHGEGGVWDGPRSAEDVRKIIEVMHRFWGSFPYEHYYFLNMITEAGGGLEHKESTLMMTSRWRSGDPKLYRRWLGLVSHEYFHAWNVKRLRPEPLGPFDYENEVYSKSLWVAEGVTSYYDDLLLRRAGLLSREQYLEALSEQIKTLRTTPGRKVRSVELASFDSWIKQYRPDENSRNTTISYYTKGAVVAFLLDARIRRATSDQRSLDDVMRMAFELYSGPRGYTPREFRAVASEIAGEDLSAFFETALETTEDLDYEEALSWYGLHFASRDENEDKPDTRESGWLGIETRNAGGRLVVSRVLHGGPAHTAGLNVGDELLAIDGYRVHTSSWGSRLDAYPPGSDVVVLVARREALRELAVVMGAEPDTPHWLEVDPGARPSQTEHLDSWLESH